MRPEGCAAEYGIALHAEEVMQIGEHLWAQGGGCKRGELGLSGSAHKTVNATSPSGARPGNRAEENNTPRTERCSTAGTSAPNPSSG